MTHVQPTWLQIDASQPAKDKVYKGVVDCARKIARQEGYRGFFGGCLVKVGLGSMTAVMLVMYDEVMNAVAGY